MNDGHTRCGQSDHWRDELTILPEICGDTGVGAGPFGIGPGAAAR